MLAESADDIDAALAELGAASLEYKLDGARIQVHKADDEVKVLANLRDVTSGARRRAIARLCRRARSSSTAKRSPSAGRRRILPGHDAAVRAEARRRSAA
jgi:hypothetical protein